MEFDTTVLSGIAAYNSATIFVETLSNIYKKVQIKYEIEI